MNVSMPQQSLANHMGPSPQVAALQADVERVAPTDYSVLVLGETGTGKELVAKAIQEGSRRRSAPLVPLDCGAIPATLIEAELFGHLRGAFTGADRQKSGKVEAAAGGTLFLDEISNLPPPMQAKLLRLLQERCFYRIGATSPTAADVRVICATNADPLGNQPETGFRTDLYYRIAEYVIRVPPLRERKEDVPYLAKRFVARACSELGRGPCRLTDCAVESLLAWDWPGNVRELRNVVRRAVLAASDEVTAEEIGALGTERWSETTDEHRTVDAVVRGVQGGHLHLTISPSNGADGGPAHGVAEGQVEHGEPCPASLKDIVERSVAAVETLVLKQALERAHGNKAHAARMLKVDYKTIYLKIKKYGIYTKTVAGADKDKQDDRC